MHLNLFKTKAEEKIDIYYDKMTPLIENIIGMVRGEKPTLYGSLEGEKTLLEPADILYFDTVDRRSFAYTTDAAYQISSSIAGLEEELKHFGFVRINKSNMVNIYQIVKIKPEPNMRIRVLLKNGEYLQINRAYKRSFEEYLKLLRRSI